MLAVAVGVEFVPKAFPQTHIVQPVKTGSVGREKSGEKSICVSILLKPSVFIPTNTHGLIDRSKFTLRILRNIVLLVNSVQRKGTRQHSIRKILVSDICLEIETY